MKIYLHLPKVWHTVCCIYR